MTFESYTGALWFLLGATFAVAFIMGAVVRKTDFCTMGGVSDWVNMGDTGRFRAWLFAIAVALLGALALEGFAMIDLGTTFPPYRGQSLIWAENVIGGVMFGVGMTLGSGCANKNLVRLGGGNIKSLFVVTIMGVCAYFMIFPFPGSDQTLYTLAFLPWVSALSINLGTHQDLGSLISSGNPLTARLVVGGILAAALIGFVFRSTDFRGRFDNVFSGLVIGLAVVVGWYVTATVAFKNPDPDFFFGGQETVSLQQASAQSNWELISGELPEGTVRPIRSAFMGTQSFTFVNPTGQAVGYAGSGLSKAYLTFGLMAFAGVILGSFVWSLLSRRLRVEWFASLSDFVRHAVGAVLMGIGGVLALGCTIGQGVTGVSTLAVGSIIAFVSIVFGSALTMKVQYYQMVYEGEASFTAALLSSLVDMRLLPKGMRRLEAV
jgi:hypothetical protein